MKTKYILFLSLFFLSCKKEIVSITILNQKDASVIIPTTKNYLQPSIDLRKSNLWVDYYGIPKLNGIKINNIFYDCPNVIADFNGDGYDDVLMAPSVYGNDNKRYPVELYLNNKDNNTFKLDTSFIRNNIGTNNARKAIVGDFNGDGKPDVVFAEQGPDVFPFNGSEQTILLSNGPFYDFKILIITPFFGHGVCSGDFDKDGDLDIYFTGNNDKSYFLINDGKGNFTNQPTKINLNNYGEFTCEFHDINKDGFLDLIIGGADAPVDNNNQPIKIMFGNGINYDTLRSINLPLISKWGINVDFNFADLDNDGVDEIIVNKTQDQTGNLYQGYKIQILKNIGNYVYNDITDKIIQNYNETSTKWIVWLRIEDIDNNGKLDIFDSDKGHYNTNTSIRWEQDIDGVFKKK